MTQEDFSNSIKMVDVGQKPPMERVAVAIGKIKLKSSTITRIRQQTLEKGDVITVSKVAGIAAAKKTPDLLPLCHPLALNKVSVEIELMEDVVRVIGEVKANERTGVEMEALTVVSAALLNIWDMTKMYEKDENGQYPTTAIQDIRVIKKLKTRVKE